ncbi:MAG TPA: radical SAM protein [bacterium]|nr:radical SAM protein [bacterium]
MKKTALLARKIWRRALGLPRGAQFFRYAANRVAFASAMRRRRLSLPHPTSLMLEVTNLCQLHCITCPREYAMGSRMDKGHMDFEQAKQLLDGNLVYLDSIGLTGLGETLLYPHLIELVDYIRAKNKGVYIFISTNAQQPNAPEIVNALADKIDSLQISIDGIGEAFEQVRRNSDWAKYLANVKAIAKVARGRRVQLKFNMVVLEANHHQMVDVIELAAELGIPEVYFNTFNLVANDWDTSYYKFYHTEGFKQALARAADLARSKGIAVGYDDIASARSFAKCPFPWNHFYVTWDGFLVPCCAKPFPKEQHFGNVFKSSLVECINSADFAAFRRLSIEGAAPGFCVRCHVVTDAGSGSTADQRPAKP